MNIQLAQCCEAAEVLELLCNTTAPGIPQVQACDVDQARGQLKPTVAADVGQVKVSEAAELGQCGQGPVLAWGAEHVLQNFNSTPVR
jgi:hypothetical protein